jgi:hypothetical protein
MSHPLWIFRDSTIKTANARTDTPLNLITRTGVFFFWISAIFNVETAQPTRYKILYPFDQVSSKGESTMQPTSEAAMTHTNRLPVRHEQGKAHPEKPSALVCKALWAQGMVFE